jgi:hypothetical protein
MQELRKYDWLVISGVRHAAHEGCMPGNSSDRDLTRSDSPDPCRSILRLPEELIGIGACTIVGTGHQHLDVSPRPCPAITPCGPGL